MPLQDAGNLLGLVMTFRGSSSHIVNIPELTREYG